MGMEAVTIIAAVIGVIGTVASTILAYYLNRKSSQLEQQSSKLEQLEGELSQYKKGGVHAESYIHCDYGIKIISPRDEPIINAIIEVTGIYSVMPPPKAMRLFVAHGECFWPQEMVTKFFPETRTWRARADISGLPIPTGGSIIVAIVGQPTNVLWDYFFKVGNNVVALTNNIEPPIGWWWPFEGWPHDSVECHRVPVTRA